MIISADLKVANMSKSASGTVGQSDRNLWEKTGLTGSLIDRGWHGLRRQLEQKQFWLGDQVLAINPYYGLNLGMIFSLDNLERGFAQLLNQTMKRVLLMHVNQ